MEIIVIDDGSSDDTAKQAGKAGAKIIRQKNEGKVVALNAGVKKAAYDVIVTIDADTFVEENCLDELVRPLADKHIGSTTGIVKVKKQGILTWFQSMEYLHNHLIRTSFARTFSAAIWIFGSLSAFKKEALAKAGNFSNDTAAEDMDIALCLEKKGYTVQCAEKAIAYTIAPNTLHSLFRQRIRWWGSTLHALEKNRKGLKKELHILFIYINQWWWSIWALMSFPLIAYQIVFWLPEQGYPFYFFSWFSITGILNILMKILIGSFSILTLSGILLGLVSTTAHIFALIRFREVNYQNLIASFFYFPYVLIINLTIFFSIFFSSKKRKQW